MSQMLKHCCTFYFLLLAEDLVLGPAWLAPYGATGATAARCDVETRAISTQRYCYYLTVLAIPIARTFYVASSCHKVRVDAEGLTTETLLCLIIKIFESIKNSPSKYFLTAPSIPLSLLSA